MYRECHVCSSTLAMEHVNNVSRIKLTINRLHVHFHNNQQSFPEQNRLRFPNKIDNQQTRFPNKIAASAVV